MWLQKYNIYLTTIHFYWIPGHTNNKFHQQIDRIATRSLQQYKSYTLTIHQLLQNNTDATASVGHLTLNSHELELLKKKKKFQTSNWNLSSYISVSGMCFTISLYVYTKNDHNHPFEYLHSHKERNCHTITVIKNTRASCLFAYSTD